MSKPRYYVFDVLPCAFLLVNDEGERRYCLQRPNEHMHTPAEDCERSPERHHAYLRPKRHRHATQ